MPVYLHVRSRPARAVLAGLATVMSGCTPSTDEVRPPERFIAAPAGEPESLVWSDLMPLAELETLEQQMTLMDYASLPAATHDESAPAAGQTGSYDVVEDLDGLHIRMPGYLLPLDAAARGRASEFLLVPFYGACVHYPPPPPNQIVYVVAAEPVSVSEYWEARWVEGVLETRVARNGLGDAAYTLYLSRSEPYRPAP
jgi:uncharacterized protein